VGKLIGGFILGFLACVWTYGLDPTEAALIFGGKETCGGTRTPWSRISRRPAVWPQGPVQQSQSQSRRQCAAGTPHIGGSTCISSRILANSADGRATDDV